MGLWVRVRFRVRVRVRVSAGITRQKASRETPRPSWKGAGLRSSRWNWSEPASSSSSPASRVSPYWWIARSGLGFGLGFGFGFGLGLGSALG